MASQRQESGMRAPLVVVAGVVLLLLAGAGSAQQEGCRVAADLVVMIDGSGSVEDNGLQGWAKQLNFSLEFIDAVEELFFGDVRVAFGWFAGDDSSVRSSIEVPLSRGDDFALIRQTIRNSFASHPDGYTPTHTAAQLAREQFDLHGRPNITRMLVLVSDGQPAQPGQTDIESARQATAALETLKSVHNVRVLSVAIQVASNDDDAGTVFMRSVASDPKEVYSHSLTSFDDLSGILAPATTASCLQIDALSKNCGLIQHKDEITITGKYLYDLTNDGRLMNCRFQFGDAILLANALPVAGSNGTQVTCEVPWYAEPAVAFVEVTIDGRVFTDNRLTFEYVTDLAECLTISETAELCVRNATERVIQVVGNGLRRRSFDANDYQCRFRDTVTGTTSQTFGEIVPVLRNESRTMMLCDSPDWANVDNRQYPNAVAVEATINAGGNWTVNSLEFRFSRFYNICPRPIGGDERKDAENAPTTLGDDRCLVGAVPCWAFSMIVGVLGAAVFGRVLWACVRWKRLAALSQKQWTVRSQQYSWTETDPGSSSTPAGAAAAAAGGAASRNRPRTLLLDFSADAPDAAPTPSNRRLRVAATNPDGSLVLESYQPGFFEVCCPPAVRYRPGFFEVCCPSLVLCCARNRARVVGLARRGPPAAADAEAGGGADAGIAGAEPDAAPEAPAGSTVTPGAIVNVDYVPVEEEEPDDTLLQPLSPRAGGGGGGGGVPVHMDFV